MFQTHLARRHQAQGVIRAGSAHIGQLLALAHINNDVLGLGGHTHHHAFINGHAGSDEQAATFLCIEQAVGNGFAGFKGNQAAGVPAGDITLVGRVGIKNRGHDALALGIGEELVAVAEQAAGGHQKFHLHAIADRGHLKHFALSAADLFDYGSHSVGGYIHHQALHRLAQNAIDLPVQHTGRGDLELIAFAAHGLDQDRQMHLAPSGHVKAICGIFQLADPQGNVLQRLPEQPVAQLA